MFVLYLGFFGILIFVLGILGLGYWLRRNPSKLNAEKTSRVAHFLFFACLGTPVLVGFFFPGLHHLDRLVSLPSLPFQPFFLFFGILLGLPGIYFAVVSNISLRKLGSGTNAFRLTQRIVDLDIYQHTRNPMSLGYYLSALSIAFLSGSTLLTLYVLAGLIPLHLFFLKYFEELELGLRFGESYQQYKQKVSFLIPN